MTHAQVEAYLLMTFLYTIFLFADFFLKNSSQMDDFYWKARHLKPSNPRFVSNRLKQEKDFNVGQPDDGFTVTYLLLLTYHLHPLARVCILWIEHYLLKPVGH